MVSKTRAFWVNSQNQKDKEDTVEIQKELFKEGGKLAKYQDLVLGERGLFKLFKYELIVALSSAIPGALGLFLRSRLR